MSDNILNKIDKKTLALDAAGALGGAGVGYLLSRLLHDSPSGGRSLLYSLLGATAGAAGAHYGQNKYRERINAALAATGTPGEAKTDKKSKNNPLHTGIAAGVGAGAGELALGGRFATAGRRLTSVAPGVVDPKLLRPALKAGPSAPITDAGRMIGQTSGSSIPKSLVSTGITPGSDTVIDVVPEPKTGLKGLYERLIRTDPKDLYIDREGNLTTKTRERIGTIGGHAAAAGTGAVLGVGAQLLGNALYHRYGDRTDFAANRSKTL